MDGSSPRGAAFRSHFYIEAKRRDLKTARRLESLQVRVVPSKVGDQPLVSTIAFFPRARGYAHPCAAASQVPVRPFPEMAGLKNCSSGDVRFQILQREMRGRLASGSWARSTHNRYLAPHRMSWLPYFNTRHFSHLLHELIAVFCILFQPPPRHSPGSLSLAYSARSLNVDALRGPPQYSHVTQFFQEDGLLFAMACFHLRFGPKFGYSSGTVPVNPFSKSSTSTLMSFWSRNSINGRSFTVACSQYHEFVPGGV